MAGRAKFAIWFWLVNMIHLVHSVDGTCIYHLSRIDLNDDTQPQLQLFRQAAADAWDGYLSNKLGCGGLLSTATIDNLFHSNTTTSTQPFHELYNAIAFRLPRAIKTQGRHEIYQIVMEIRQHVFEAEQQLGQLNETVRAPDLLSITRCAQRDLSGLFGFQLWSAMFKFSASDSEVRHVVEKSTFTISHAAECQGAAGDLKVGLSCVSRDVAATAEVLDTIRDELDQFVKHWNPYADDALKSTSLALCGQLLVNLGVEKMAASDRCHDSTTG